LLCPYGLADAAATFVVVNVVHSGTDRGILIDCYQFMQLVQ